MSTTTPPGPPERRRLLEPVLLAALFATAHTQAPVAYSNQNQYLLHGYALAGYGHLDNDWLAHTADPTPLFSWFVAGGFGAFGAPFLHAAYFAVVMGYFLAARSLALAVAPASDTRTGRVTFAALFTAAHAGVLRWLSVQLAGVDYPWFLQAGVANQYLLGPGLQPSTFGVLLVGALAAFAHGRPLTAGLLTSAAGLMHPTYLLPGALLVLGVLAQLVAAGQRRRAAVVGSVALAAALPAAAYTAWKFGPTSADVFAEAQRILAESRIPHHAVVSRWLDGVAGAQIAWALLGVALVRRSPLFTVLAVLAGGGLVLSLVQVATGSHTLALLFPWRVTAVLVPTATAIAAAKLAARIPAARIVTAVSALVLTGLAAGGVWVMAEGVAYHMASDEVPVLTWIKYHAEPNEVYLIPVRVPAPGVRGTPATPSTSFTPPPRPDPESNLIPVDFQRFRLFTGSAAFVDFKSVPYRDADVLEWRRRLRLAKEWYDDTDWRRPGLRDVLQNEKITHVVVRRGREPASTFLEAVYKDESYTVVRVRTGRRR